MVLDVGFSTRAGGKDYIADVTYAYGQYVADDVDLVGAIARGGSVSAAENNLARRIDLLA